MFEGHNSTHYNLPLNPPNSCLSRVQNTFTSSQISQTGLGHSPINSKPKTLIKMPPIKNSFISHHLNMDEILSIIHPGTKSSSVHRPMKLEDKLFASKMQWWSRYKIGILILEGKKIGNKRITGLKQVLQHRKANPIRFSRPGNDPMWLGVLCFGLSRTAPALCNLCIHGSAFSHSSSTLFHLSPFQPGLEVFQQV